MRHGKSYRKFGRNASHRRALLRSLATSFIKHERFETTVEKAKELRPIVERLITSGRVDTLAERRKAYSYLLDKAVVHKLFTDVGPRFKARAGGYTRVVRTRVRHGDAAEMAVLEMVEKADPKQKKIEGKNAAGKADKAAAKATKPPAKKSAPSKKVAAAAA